MGVNSRLPDPEMGPLLMLNLLYQSGDTNALEKLDLSTENEPDDRVLLNGVGQLALVRPVRLTGENDTAHYYFG